MPIKVISNGSQPRPLPGRNGISSDPFSRKIPGTRFTVGRFIRLLDLFKTKADQINSRLNRLTTERFISHKTDPLTVLRSLEAKIIPLTNPNITPAAIVGTAQTALQYVQDEIGALPPQARSQAEPPTLAEAPEKKQEVYVSKHGNSYTIIEQNPFDQGGMGEIWRAKTSDGTIVVMKKFKFEKILSEAKERLTKPGLERLQKDLIDRCIEEIRLGKKMDHLNIGEIIDYGLHEKREPFMIQPYYTQVHMPEPPKAVKDQPIPKAAPSLAPLIKKRLISTGRAVNIFIQVFKAIVSASRSGVVHRDLKPRNILITEDSNEEDLVKVIDWGIAKNVEREQTLTQSGLKPPGSPAYKAPDEYYALPKIRQPLIDVFQGGLNLYETLTGTNPFREMDEDQMRAAKKGEVPFELQQEHIPDRLFDIIKRLMSSDPDKNFRDPEEALEALENLKTSPGKTISSAKEPAFEPRKPVVLPAAPPQKFDINNRGEVIRYLLAVNQELFTQVTPVERLKEINTALLRIIEKYPDDNDIQIQYAGIQAKISDLIAQGRTE